MKEFYVVRSGTTKSGNPKYLIDITLYPELREFGRKVKNKCWLKSVISYNLREEIANFLNLSEKDIEVKIIYL